MFPRHLPGTLQGRYNRCERGVKYGLGWREAAQREKSLGGGDSAQHRSSPRYPNVFPISRKTPRDLARPRGSFPTSRSQAASREFSGLLLGPGGVFLLQGWEVWAGTAGHGCGASTAAKRVQNPAEWGMSLGTAKRGMGGEKTTENTAKMPGLGEGRIPASSERKEMRFPQVSPSSET